MSCVCNEHSNVEAVEAADKYVNCKSWSLNDRFNKEKFNSTVEYIFSFVRHYHGVRETNFLNYHGHALPLIGHLRMLILNTMISPENYMMYEHEFHDLYTFWRERNDWSKENIDEDVVEALDFLADDILSLWNAVFTTRTVELQSNW